MFKDLGYQLLIKWKLWKVLVVIFPFTFIYGIYLLFVISSNSDRNSFDGSQLIHAEVNNQLAQTLSLAAESYMKEFGKTNDIHQLLMEKLSNLGLETFSQEKYKNVIGKLKAPRSPDYECSLISFEYNDESPNIKIRSIAYVLALIKLYQSDQINYLSRDIIFVGYHTNYKRYGQGITAFLEEYVNPQRVSFMPRSGTIRSSININLDDKFDSVALKVFGLNGKVSDRDYYNSINMLMEKQSFQYQFTETNYNWMLQLEKYLEKELRTYWKLFQLDSIYQLPQKRFLHMDPYFSNQIEMFQGDLHEAHSYIMKYGIYSLTLRGYNTQNKDDSVLLTNKLLLVGEASIKALMANDEFIHSGSTLYLPLNRSFTLTIQNYCLPYVFVILSCAIFAIKSVYSRWHFNLFNDNKEELGRSNSMVAHKAIIEIFMGFTLCFIPNMISYFNNKQYEYFDQYFVIMLVIIVTYLILIYSSRKQIFGQFSLPRRESVAEWLWVELVIQVCFVMMYAGIVHIPIATFIAIFLGPWFFFIQPLRFKPNFKLWDIFTYVINLLFLYGYFQILSYFGFDSMLAFYKQVVINYNNVGVHLFYYLNGALIPSLLRFAELLLF
ncbi:unnamed protein product (macronuclear) [Paramecium tetraurelia]|uniref:Uncharacterized protein n=1 Tax=Paramecium tetraurelia TaxID=5888 RepID=A0BYD9_PARTE|nr:uncharacterized protein GSPATT00033409001 [Paramecium tetraurelia]CAK63556.1 unnamed protein product [Paramecium tetraurelia]|eukprot:XP_001430954.1 hypothetical protein (macronuclear) [Paramecium tetraurelia strain d4-2]